MNKIALDVSALLGRLVMLCNSYLSMASYLDGLRCREHDLRPDDHQGV